MILQNIIKNIVILLKLIHYIKKKIHYAINDIGLLPNISDRLYDTCLAVNVIIDKAIAEIKTWFTQYNLAPYESLFEPKAEKSIEFSETEKRFDWIKGALK